MDDEFTSLYSYHRQPLMLIVSGPSGIGKDTVIRELQKRGMPLHVVVTMTSRAKRETEVDGYDYWFVTREKFEEMIVRGEFVEHALVYDDLKGVPRRQLQEALASNLDIIMRVDVQGARTMCKLFPKAVTIFLIPTNEKELRERIARRDTETEDGLNSRMAKAREEMACLPEFEYVIVNAHGRLKETVDAIVAIIEAEHHRVFPRHINL